MEMERIKSDNVCHPKHYNQGGIECIDCIKSATVGKVGIEAFCVGNAIKYLFRYEEKNGIEDVKKATLRIKQLYNYSYALEPKDDLLEKIKISTDDKNNLRTF